MRHLQFDVKVAQLAGIAAVLLAAILYGPPAAAAEQKIALVIGNGAYATSRLRNPVNDANAMAEKLRTLGFEVILRTDANLREMTRSFSQFGQKLTPGSVSLFYYAGHGVQVRGKNYLIPLDAEIENEASVSSEAVDVDQLLNQLAPARLSMVILDACRNNPFERRFRASVSGGLAQIDAPTGTMLAYATAPGKVAADGAGSNGVYTDALLKVLDIPGLKVEDVFKQVRINVVKASDGQQTPWESSSLIGEFYFRPGTKAEIENAQLQRSEKERIELAKILDEERGKRNKDAELVRAQMEKLRVELLALKELAASAAATSAIAAPAARVETSTPGVTSSIAGTAFWQPTLLALAPPPAGNALFTSEWKQRIAFLEKNRDQLTFSKAIAILLDVSSPEDLTLLLTHATDVINRKHHAAHALGADKDGNLLWGSTWGWRSPAWATESALELCAGSGNACKVVSLNGEFLGKDFIEFAKKMNNQSVATVRQTFIQGLKEKISTITLRQSGYTTDPQPFGMASIRN